MTAAMQVIDERIRTLVGHHDASVKRAMRIDVSDERQTRELVNELEQRRIIWAKICLLRSLREDVERAER